MIESTIKKFKDLGFANGWRQVPKEVLQCRIEKHSLKFESVGRCLTKYTCEICGYTYKVDSSD